MDLYLKDHVVIVSGGARGIGEGITRALAAEGALPVIVGRSEADNRALCGELRGKGLKADFITAELTDPKTCGEAVRLVLERHRDVHGVVNNAGVNDGIGLERGSYEDFIASLHRNLVHYYLLVHHALPALIKTKGAVVNITSKTAETGQGNTSAYAAANGGRNALVREWAVELLKYGIRVNGVVVAECWTPQYERWIQTLADPKRKLEEITSRIPLGNRMTLASEIADATVFLLSSRSGHTTGQLLHVDGGYVHLDRALANA